MEQKQSMSIESALQSGAILKPTVIFRPTFEKEVTLRDVVNELAKEKGIKVTNMDEMAKHLMFSIDGKVSNLLHFEGSVAKMLDHIVKPNQKIEVMPAIKAG